MLLYDADCGLCARSVQFVLRHDRRGTLRFAPVQGTAAAAVRDANPHLTGIDSVVWVGPGGDVRVRSEAVLAVLRHLGGAWALLGLVARIVPRAWRDTAYEAVARRRRRLVAPACLVPSPEQRTRFLD